MLVFQKNYKYFHFRRIPYLIELDAQRVCKTHTTHPTLCLIYSNSVCKQINYVDLLTLIINMFKIMYS